MAEPDRPHAAQWQEDWEPVAGDPVPGGQGHIVRVRRRSGPQIGALKRLNEGSAHRKERRYRMNTEVQALRLLDGNGTPRVLAANTERWREGSVELFAVLDWVDGPTVLQHVNGRPLDVDEALRLMLPLIDTIVRCHAAGIVHRDIKPDNVILEEADLDRPVLVDFGMSWTERDRAPLETEPGQEIGNRFLRLPEYSAGRSADGRAPQSDVTQLVGVFFYLLTGRYPRLLTDERGRPPHQAVELPAALLGDARWPVILRVFREGFRHALADRFRDSSDLRSALMRIQAPRSPGTVDELAELSEVLRDDREVLRVTLVNSLVPALRGLGTAIVEETGTTLAVTANPYTSTNNEGWAGLSGYIHRQGVGEPKVTFNLRLALVDDRLLSSYQIDAGDWIVYSSSSALDASAVSDATTEFRVSQFGNVLAELRKKLLQRQTSTQ
jgi:serine/threonine protein kinase